MAGAAKVDFYLLKKTDEAAKLQYACRLLAKAWGGGHRCYVQTANMQQARTLDELLWTYVDLSFIPHRIYEQDDNWQAYPVQIGVVPVEDAAVTLKLNLNMQAEPQTPNVSRVLELVGSDENDKQAARARFKFYRQQGVAPDTHQL